MASGLGISTLPGPPNPNSPCLHPCLFTPQTEDRVQEGWLPIQACPTGSVYLHSANTVLREASSMRYRTRTGRYAEKNWRRGGTTDCQLTLPKGSCHKGVMIPTMPPLAKMPSQLPMIETGQTPNLIHMQHIQGLWKQAMSSLTCAHIYRVHVTHFLQSISPL